MGEFYGAVSVVRRSETNGVSYMRGYITRKPMTYTDLVADRADEAGNLRAKNNKLQKTPVSEDSTTEDGLEASGMDVRFYEKPSNWKKGTSEIKCMKINGESSSVVVCPEKILNMKSDSTLAGGFIIYMQDMQVSSDN
jgi:hypothetical protein